MDVAQVFESFGFDVRAGFVDVLHVVPHVEADHLAQLLFNVRVELAQHLSQLKVLLQLIHQCHKTVAYKELLTLIHNLLVDDL